MKKNRYMEFIDAWNTIDAESADFISLRLDEIGLHRGQAKMLRFLGENNGCRQKDIADRFFLRAASVSGLLNTLEKQGLIERVLNPKSRRETLVYLTDEGMKKLIDVYAFYDDVDKEWFEDFSDEEFTGLMELLYKMRDSLKDRLAKYR